jgi:hypothetical protein
LVRLDPWESPQIDRIELDCADVEELIVEIVRNLRDDLRLADAACAPDMQGHTLTDQRMKRLVQPGWFHLDLPQREMLIGLRRCAAGHRKEWRPCLRN